MQVEALTVIVYFDGTISSAQSFTNDERGEQQATELFKQLASEAHYEPDEIAMAVVDGEISSKFDDHKIFLVRS